MSSKDKENKFLQDKLKNFFRINKGNNAGGFKKRDEFVLTEEVQHEISRDSSAQTRTRAIKDLCDTVTTSKLDDVVATKIWGCIQDLLTEQSSEMRHLAFHFLQRLIGGQSKRLNLLRAQIFRVITEHRNNDDVVQRFELLQCLTENGKDIQTFEENMAPFLLEWFPEITKAGKTADFMSLLINLIKFNSAYINAEVITGFVNRICVLCCSNSPQAIIQNGLQIFDTIIAYYCNLPSDSIPQFIGALCRVVNEECYCTISWKVMRNLLGTHMGHSAIFTMCHILQESSLSENTKLIRGAIFFINIGLWGHQSLPNLRCPPGSVLPSILQAVERRQPIVMVEVILSMKGLVTKHGIDLQDPSWQTLLQILSIIIKQLEIDPQMPQYTLISQNLHDTLSIIEALIHTGNFNGNTTQFYNLIEECSSSRPEISILSLISYLAEDINPSKNMWLSKLKCLLNKYYRNDKEKRTNIRLKVLEILSNVVQLNRMQYEDELIDGIVVPHLMSLPYDTDTTIRSAGANLLIDLCLYCVSKRCLEMLDILEKLLNRPFVIHANDNNPAVDADTSDVKRVVTGLVRLFVVKIHKLPSLHAVRIYNMLVNHLELHYNKPEIFENCNIVRIKIFEYFLRMRADNFYRLGCPDPNGVMRYSPYLCVTYMSNERNTVASPPPPSPAIMQHAPCTVTYVPMKAGFKIFVTCLNLEKDWNVLNSVLNRIPEALQNKSLILGKHGNNDIGLLVDTIVNRFGYKSSDSLNANINKPDFFSSVLMVIPGLASYHSYLDPSHQQKMIRLLCSYKCGLGLRCFPQCITVLTACTLEMQDVMVKMLPEVLLILSKSSATVHIAIPVLEFLSTLTILPSVFSCFVADQYMAIFAILLPYTNPFKYNHYTVFLAHHVIAVWFLKCRLPFRKEFVRFITNGLQANAVMPFEETQLLKTTENLNRFNQDSSDRKRSSSLTEQRSTHRERTATVVGKPTLDFRNPAMDKDKALQSFYTELTETCIDLMARYTFSPCSALPKRLPNADFLLCGGQSMSWLLGNRVITVTTSGCSQKALKYGLCDKCYSICKAVTNKTSDEHILKTSRSGSNEKDDSTRVTRQNSGSNNTSASSPMEEDKLEQLPGKLQQLAVLDQATRNERQRCVCWCQGWAEIYIRRPTGNMSWVMRIQNQTSHQQSIYDFPLNEVSTLFMPSLSSGSNSSGSGESISRPYQLSLDEDSCNKPAGSGDEHCGGSIPISIPGSPNKQSPSRQSSRDSNDEDMDNIYEDGGKVRNPVRRSNSSPEMSANWKNPFLSQKQDRDEFRSCEEADNGKKSTKNFSKDMRVSCEAIPEEIAGMGTTPPLHDSIQQGSHPSLLTSLSCPGPTNPNEPVPVSKAYQTVPPSPNIITQQSGTTYPNNRALGTLTKSSKTDSSESVSSDKSFERPANLPNIPNWIMGKPPQSPTQTSPRLSRHNLREREAGYEIQKSVSLGMHKQKDKKYDVFGQSSNENTQMRDRSHTLSVMSPVRKPRLENLRHEHTRPNKEMPKSGINPSFVFLQLYHASQFGNTGDKPLLIDSSDIVQRALKVLDLIPPYETHQIGVIYVGHGQAGRETDILRNKYGSVRYVDFLKKLGTLIKLQDVDPQVFFLGSLDKNGGDGKFAYIWQDDVIRVMFHVATLMPNKESDPNCNNKKSHIGNNNVTIVYNESGEDYNINTIKGQFNFASVIIQPLDHNSNKVTVKAKDELFESIGNNEPKIVSDQNVALLARQLALHANLASLVFSKSRKNSNQDPYAPNWLERLRRIKNLRKKILQESKRDHLGSQIEEHSSKTKRSQMDDFTEYT